MSANLESLIQSGYDLIFPFFTCQGNIIYKKAEFFCKECSKCYCGTCGEYHNFLFKKHAIWGKEKISQWPETNVNVQEQCQKHKGEKLTAFCEDHSKLMCRVCRIYTHNQCRKVTPISELTNLQPTGLEGLSVELETVLGEIKTLQISQEASIQSLQRTYKEHREVMIEQLCCNLNTYIDECDINSVGTSGGNEQYLKEELCRNVVSIVNEFNNITAKELNEMKDEVISIKGSVTSSIHKCTTLHNDLSQFHESFQKIGDNKELCLIAIIKCKHKIQQALTLLGKSGKMFNVQRKSVHNVRIPSDSDSCDITGICALPDGQVLVVNNHNKRVKLLNQRYQVVSHWDVTAWLLDMCQITPSEVAVAMNNEVQFITVSQSQLTKGRKLELQHSCYSIAHHQGDLFIGSGTALYKYKLNGKLVCKLYENKPDNYTDMIGSCAVSPDGGRIYVALRTGNQLVTLAVDGTVISRLTVFPMKSEQLIPLNPHPYFEPDFLGLHVTDLGQVLVCGSHKIIQVDRDGRQILVEMVTEIDDVKWPLSFYFSRITQSLVVGMAHTNNILVFSTEMKEEAVNVLLAQKTKALKELIAQKTPDEELKDLLRILNIDARAECKADSFTAFSHGRAALQGIVTKGKDILDWHLFSATENQMMNCECIQLYANASLLKKIEAYSPEIISTIDYKQSRQDILFPAIVIVKEKHQYMIEDWISNIRKNITGLCVVVVCKGNIFNFDRSPQNNIFLTNANRWEVMMAAQKLLERAIYRVLKHLVKTLMQKYGTSTDLTDLEKESTLQSVYAYSRAAYQRSKLPECERLNIPAITYTYPENINDVIKTLLRIQGVVGCSKKFGILEVSVDSKQDKDKTTDQVKQLLMKEKIGATFEYGSFSHFLSPGDPVYAGEGTLGGFAQRFPKTRYNSIAADRMSSLKSPGTKGKLVALISRHVAQAFTPTENASLYIGNNIVGQIHKIPHKGILDIVPFDIHEHFIKECNTRFQTEAKKQMHGQLPENNDCLIGLPVFLWGAKSAPGLGMLDSIMDMQDAGGVQCIKIHNRIPDKPFSEPGDSGAIVCSTDSEASTLTTIAMLIGQFQNSKQPTYFAILLKEAFAELNEFYESEFKMCEDAAATP
ncbi:uncharacterized protein LOC127832260 [Dreissena polymorpha]|uniref:uncharacterized protein LOC127832260 n=1 Tax=Dreissena polymorpha TaxID=45954 RepID=UPI0022651ADB|nr:uncharacterized protein LOC127832260 [Dreissena polymorpha]